MSVVTETEFNSLCHQLSAHMLREGGKFLEGKGLGTYSPDALAGQMSTDIDHLSLEILTFGGDVWPAQANSFHPEPIIYEPKHYPPRFSQSHAIVLSIAAVAFTALLAFSLATIAGRAFVDMLLLTDVAVIALFLGAVPAMIATFLSGASYTWFFIEPLYTLWVPNLEDRADIAALCALGLGVSLLIAWIRSNTHMIRLV